MRIPENGARGNVKGKRQRRVEITERRLLRRSWPRLQVSLILSLTGMAGFLTSFCLLHLGVSRMWLRYPIAILTAYGVFLMLLGIWLWLQRHSPDIDPDLSTLDFTPSSTSGPGESLHFGGGDAGAGGAGGSWGESVSPASTASSESSGSADIGFDLDFGEGCLVVIALLAVAGGLVASFYVIYIAPALLAEILVDGAMVAGLYRRVKNIEPGNWLQTAVRRTILPAILAAVFFTIAGVALQKAYPAAQSIGDVWNQLKRS